MISFTVVNLSPTFALFIAVRVGGIFLLAQ